VDGLEWLRPKWRGLGAKYFRFASWLSTKLFDVVITDSSNMARIYGEEFHCPSTVIAYGAPIQYSTSPQLIQGLGLSPGSYYLVVARLVPDNNGDLIVVALRGPGPTENWSSSVTFPTGMTTPDGFGKRPIRE